MNPPKPPPGFQVDEVTPPEGFVVDKAPSIMEHKPQPVAPPETKRNVAESALQGFGQGASFGFSDELAGLAAEALSTGTPFTPGIGPLIDDETAYQLLGTKSAMEHPYRAVRDAQRQEVKTAQAANPGSYLAGNVAGAIATPGPKGLGAAKLAKQGAAYGALAGAGMSDADLADGELWQAALDTSMGAGTGAVTAPVASGLSARLGRFLQNRSQENALKAVGARAGISDVLGNAGIETADDARRLGQRAIDMGLVKPFRTAADVTEGTGYALQREGARIEGVLSDADKAAQPFDFDRAAWSAVGEVMGPNGLTTAAIDKSRPTQKVIDQIIRQGKADPTFGAANRLKSDIYGGINYGVDPTLTTEMQRSAARGLRKSIEEQVEGRLGTEAADELRSANQNYGDLKKIQSLSGDEARRQIGRAGPLSPGTIAASIAAGNPAPMAAKAAAPFIPSTLSWAQRNASRLVRPALGATEFPAAERAGKAVTQKLTEQEQKSIDAFLKGG